MKTSTKILIAGFAVVLLLIITVHIIWYTKYKNGQYSLYNVEDADAEGMQTFPNVSAVSLLNLTGSVVTLSDVAQVPPAGDNDLSYVRRGDTLIISAPDDKNKQPVRSIKVPANAALSLVNSSITFIAPRAGINASPRLHLKNSIARFGSIDSPLSLGHVSIAAEDLSIASFGGKIDIGFLDLNLSKSTIEFSGNNIDSISIVTDSASTISLPYKQLLKAKISTR